MIVQSLYSDNNNVTIIPSWASNKEALVKIASYQHKKINPDAIFGRIDARNFLLELNQLFQLENHISGAKDERGSSAR